MGSSPIASTNQPKCVNGEPRSAILHDAPLFSPEPMALSYLLAKNDV